MTIMTMDISIINDNTQSSLHYSQSHNCPNSESWSVLLLVQVGVVLSSLLEVCRAARNGKSGTQGLFRDSCLLQESSGVYFVQETSLRNTPDRKQRALQDCGRGCTRRAKGDDACMRGPEMSQSPILSAAGSPAKV